MNNTEVVDTASKYIVKTTGAGSETNEVLVDAIDLTGGTNQSLVSLIECYYLIEGTGTLTISTDSESTDLTLTGKGKYGLRPNQLKYGNDKIFNLTTDSNVKSYLLVTEFRRN
ncbi:MAG: hypothetical protein H8D92_00900 [Pelagibacteraceae bacterium]|jgi:hypothetical protein|nr:hypothetical protein [Pelagibacteraceae bacterium]